MIGVKRMKSIEEFDVGQFLGAGGFSSVYRARHRPTGLDVAVKITIKKDMIEMGTMGRIKSEIQIHQRLKHKNVISFFGSFEDDECVYIVMELFNYGTVYQYLQSNGPLREDLAVIVIRQLVNGLDYIHAQGIVHRDLKLSNILLSGDIAQDPHNVVVKVCDFGFAVEINHPDEEHYTLCGTPNYLAPEVAAQRAHGFPADLWGVGCLFYSMVVGTPPFAQQQQQQCGGGGGNTQINGNGNGHGNNAAGAAAGGAAAGDGNGVRETLQRIMALQYQEPVGVISEQGMHFLRSLLQLVSGISIVFFAKQPDCYFSSHKLFHQYFHLTN